MKIYAFPAAKTYYVRHIIHPKTNRFLKKSYTAHPHIIKMKTIEKLIKEIIGENNSKMKKCQDCLIIFIIFHNELIP